MPPAVPKGGRSRTQAPPPGINPARWAGEKQKPLPTTPRVRMEGVPFVVLVAMVGVLIILLILFGVIS